MTDQIKFLFTLDKELINIFKLLLAEKKPHFLDENNNLTDKGLEFALVITNEYLMRI